LSELSGVSDDVLVSSLRGAVNNARPIAFFFYVKNLKRTVNNFEAIIEWLNVWNQVGAGGLNHPIVIFFCISFQLSPFPAPLRSLSGASRFTVWLRKVLEKHRPPNLEILVLDELPIIRFQDLRAWAEVAVPSMDPTPTTLAKMPAIPPILRRHFYLRLRRLKRWHMEDVFEILEPVIREKLSS
jgi:hypothetical protein